MSQVACAIIPSKWLSRRRSNLRRCVLPVTLHLSIMLMISSSIRQSSFLEQARVSFSLINQLYIHSYNIIKIELLPKSSHLYINPIMTLHLQSEADNLKPYYLKIICFLSLKEFLLFKIYDFCYYNAQWYHYHSEISIPPLQLRHVDKIHSIPACNQCKWKKNSCNNGNYNYNFILTCILHWLI